MADIFISYAREDAPLVEKLSAALEARGYSVWWDRNLAGGARYLKKTEAELVAAAAVIVVWTKHSVDSHWVQDEAAIGRDAARLVPLSPDGTMPPLGFRQFQVIDFSRYRTGEEAPLRALFEAIAPLATPGAAPGAKPAPPAAPLWRRMPLLFAAGAAAVVLAAAASVIFSGALAPKPPAEAATAYRSIAVLAFADDSQASDQQVFADTLADAVLNVLARNRDLQVAARTSSFVFRDRNVPTSEIAAALGADLILGGSVARDGDRLRVRPELLDARTGRLIWTEVYTESIAEGGFFGVQDKISADIALALRTQLGGGPPRVKTPANETARLAYMEGETYRVRGDTAARTMAIDAYGRATAADPDFAPAWARLAHARMPADASDMADVERQLAIAERLDPGAEEVLEARAAACFFRGDTRCGLDAIDRVIALNPSSATAYGRRVELLGMQLKLRSAEVDAEQALRLDPLGVATNISVTPLYIFSNRPERAIASLERALRANPDAWFLHFRLGLARLTTGDRQGLLDQVAGLALAPNDPVARGFAGGAGFLAGLEPEELDRLSGSKVTAARLRAMSGLPVDLRGIPRAEIDRLPPLDRGILLAMAGDFRGARPFLETAHDTNPLMTSLMDGPGVAKNLLLIARREAADAAGVARLEQEIRADLANAVSEGVAGSFLAALEANFAAARGESAEVFRLYGEHSAFFTNLSPAMLSGTLVRPFERDPSFAAFQADLRRDREDVRQWMEQQGATARLRQIIRDNYPG